MEITGRLTSDAKIKKTKDHRELVAFTIVVNDYYKTKEGEKKDMTTFINCSYWLSTKIAPHLTKSSIVTVTGRIDMNVYKDRDGEVRAFLVFHVNAIKIVSKARSGSTIVAEVPDGTDDLPF